jgi:hypothetical protein
MKINLFKKYFEPTLDIPNKKINKKSILPTPSTYTLFKENNYNVEQLRRICNDYDIKVTANKPDRFNICYNILKLFFYAKIIQKFARINLIKKYNLLHGPAFLNPQKCTNSTEFYSLEDIKDIDYYHFFSYIDEKNNIYGFNINSIYKLIYKHKSTNNPYNREKIPREVIINVKKYIRYNKILKIVEDKTEEEFVNHIEIFNQHMVVRIFQMLDSLGNYTDIVWFNELDRRQLILFLRELYDIWNHRAQLSIEKKREICTPYGNPFMNININHISDPRIMLNPLKNMVLIVIERLINTGIDRANKILGGLYVLMAFTLVHPGAANALPGLYTSVAHV